MGQPPVRRRATARPVIKIRRTGMGGTGVVAVREAKAVAGTVVSSLVSPGQKLQRLIHPVHTLARGPRRRLRPQATLPRGHGLSGTIAISLAVTIRMSRICSHDWQRLPVMPPPPGSGPPIAAGSWERCDDPVGYYPYISQCRRQWEPVMASSPVPGDDPDGIALIGQWYYCEDAQNYLPYIGSCPHIWRTISAVPPPNIQLTNKPKAGG